MLDLPGKTPDTKTHLGECTHSSGVVMHNFEAFELSNRFLSAVNLKGEISIMVVGDIIFHKELENKTQLPNNGGDI